MTFGNIWPIAGLTGGYAVFMNHVDFIPRVELRGGAHPAVVADIVTVDAEYFIVATNHYNGMYAFQGGAYTSTLKRWTQSGGHLVAEVIGTPDSYPPGALTSYVSPTMNVLHSAWLSSDGTAVALVGLLTTQSAEYTISDVTVYDTTDGSTLWAYQFNDPSGNWGPYVIVQPDSFVLLSATRFFVANQTSDALEVYDETGTVVQSIPGGFTEFAGPDSHWTGVGVDSIGYIRTEAVTEYVDIYFNELQTSGPDLAWGRAEARIETDWLIDHLNTGPSLFRPDDMATAAFVASHADTLVVSANVATGAYPTELVTHYYIDPSAGTFDLSDPGTLPAGAPYELFPAGDFVTWVSGTVPVIT